MLKIDPSGEAVKDMAVGSLFLRNLNSVPSPSNIKNYAIYGKIGNPFNLMFWYYYRNNAFYSGDKIVPIDSQKGYDIMTEYPNRSYWVWNPEKIVEVNANHFIDELTDQETLNAILSLLDSTKPELEIISPDPNKTTEIYETSIHIQGKVYKEYLPADSTLTINVVRQEDGYISPPQTSLLKPSDLWIPNNPDSVVAEFDELINFPGKGTYKISCQITNPAGLTSDIKDVWIRVLQGEGKIIKVIAKENPHPEPWTDEIVQRELIITSQVYRFDEVNNNWNLIKEIDTSNDLILETNNKYRIDFYNTLIRDDLFLKSFSFKINDDGSLEILDGDGSTYFEQINSGYNIVILFERLAIEILKADNKDVDEYWAYEGEQARNISVITTPATSITTGQPDNPNRGDSVFHRLHVPVQGSLQGETYTNNNIGSISSDVTYFQEGESYFITKLHYSSESEGGGYGGQACVNNGMPYFTAFDVIGTACVVNSYSIVGHITGFGSYDRNISYNENNYYNFNEKIIRDASYLEEGKRRICLGISPVSWNGRMYSPAYSSAPFSTDLLFEADNVVITCAPGKGYVGFDEGVVGE